MDLWKSELGPEDSTSVLAVNEQFVESPKLSSASNSVQGSPESYSNHLEPLRIEIAPKAALLAKKRLQAYCSGKTDIGQENKQSDCSNEKVVKFSNHKSNKIYPDDSAKAVIRDIELLKKAGYGNDQIPSDCSSVNFSRAGSHSPSENNGIPNNSILEHNKTNMFKRREIKCRNIRKNDTNPRKSPSPAKNDDVVKEDVKKNKLEYPKNWEEYKEMRLSTRKDGDLKSKLFKKSREKKFEFKRYFTFEAPSAPLEPFKLIAKGREHLSVPFSYLRCTAAKPAIMYSEVQRQGSKGFLTRKQLFTLIPEEHKTVIEKLEKFSRYQPDDKPAINGKWYPKTWRKVENSEAMLLEQSVGLSFLQGYSDEEEDTATHPVIQDNNQQDRQDEDDTSTEPNIIQVNNQQEETAIELTDSVLNKPIENTPTKENENFSQEEEEDLTPQGTPRIVRASSTEDFEEIQDDLREVINAKRSRWENDKTLIDNDEIEDLRINDYEETRKELEKLEASLEPLELTVEGSVGESSHKKRSRKRKKHKTDIDKVKKRKSSKRTVSSSDSENHLTKKHKRKKGSSKGKVDKYKKRKSKKKKRKVELSSGSESEATLEVLAPKKKRKKNFESRTIKNNSEDSLEKKHLESDAEENYEADIKFFADRLDAEKRLKGKSKNRQVKTIIVLDDLDLQENKDKPIKEEIKVDLLKLNEDYLREQKKKDLTVDIEEPKIMDEIQIKQEVIESYDDLMMLEDIPIPPQTKIEECTMKRKCTESDFNEPEVKKVKLPPLELIPLSEIKLEKDIIPVKELESINCWESEEELFVLQTEPVSNIELPPTLLLENIKVEKDILNIEDLQKKTAALIAEGEKRLKKENVSQVPKRSVNVDPEFFDIEAAPIDDNQWDIASPAVKVVIIDLDTNNSNSCAVLENEYEEFIKSVSTADIDEPEPQQVKSIEIDSSSDSSLQLIEEVPKAAVVDVPAVHIPLPPPPLAPKPDEAIKPVPVPSPKIEAVLDLNKPMINLSLSANVTQNITLSLATSIPSISTPTTTSINFSKPNVEISNDTMVSMNNISLPLHKAPNDIKVNHFLVPPQPPEAFINISPPKVVETEPELGTFTSISLPSKRVLIDNSNVKLDDSDPEDQPMQLTKLEQHHTEELKQKDSEVVKRSEVVEKSEKSRRKSSPPRRGSKRESSPRSRRGRDSPVRKRHSSPRRRQSSPRRRSPGRRSPFRRRRSPGKRISLSPRRRLSPSRRRRSPSPKRRSPHKTRTTSPRRRRSFSPKGRRSSGEFKERKRSKTPIRRTLSPLKRSVADSTISDEQLQMDEYERLLSPRRKREMDIHHMAEMQFQQQHYQYEQYSAIQAQVTLSRELSAPPQNTYKQVGNMLQIVPAADLSKIPSPPSVDMRVRNFAMLQSQPPPPLPSSELRPKILQVGNMLQIVPTDIVPPELLPPEQPPEIKTEICDPDFIEDPLPTSGSPSPEAAMMLKVAERRAEREKRRLERERRRKEKEKRRKEKEKVRQAKLKIKTELMIKKALELEEEEDSELLSDQQTAQWPPTPLLVGHLKEAGKSILVNRSLRSEESFIEERKPKTVHFADGIRPGEGTSPSAGEELTSPPPPEQKLPKEKRYKKFSKKSLKKKKVKVRIIRRPPSPLEESDSEDNLPPPSPPPGSPPPHVFPPRIKGPAVNNVPPAYLATIMQAAQHQQLQHPAPGPYQPGLYRPPLGMMMAPLPQGHLQPSLIPVPPHNLVAPPQPGLPPGHLQPLHSRVQSPHGSISVPSPSPHMMQHTSGMPSHIQSPHGIMPSNLSVPPPPLPPPHNPGHSRHY